MIAIESDGTHREAVNRLAARSGNFRPKSTGEPQPTNVHPQAFHTSFLGSCNPRPRGHARSRTPDQAMPIWPEAGAADGGRPGSLGARGFAPRVLAMSAYLTGAKARAFAPTSYEGLSRLSGTS